MFSSCKELTGKPLADHLIKGGSWLEDCVNIPQAGLQAWIRVHVGMLGPLLGFDSFGPFEWRCWSKIHGTHNAPLFPSGEFDLHQLEKYCVFDLVVVRNGEALILACSNVHIFGELFYFWDCI